MITSSQHARLLLHSFPTIETPGRGNTVTLPSKYLAFIMLPCSYDKACHENRQLQNKFISVMPRELKMRVVNFKLLLLIVKAPVLQTL